ARISHLAGIRKVYADMTLVIGHHSPQTQIGTGFFQVAPDFHAPAGAIGLGFTAAGGWRHPGVSKILVGDDGAKHPLRIDAVYLYTKRLQTWFAEAFPYTIVHEVAHFVGGDPKTPAYIGDTTYHVRPDFFSLSPQAAAHTADSY